MKTFVLLVGLMFSQILCAAEGKSEYGEKRVWSRSRIGEPMPDGKNTRLDIGFISQDSDHLTGLFSLTRKREATLALSIQGHLNKSGQFTPNVCLEVSNQEDGDWKIIESSMSDRVDVTLNAAPHVDVLFVRIQLDAFQPLIGKFKFCRVSLQGGESDVFPMVWLTEKGE